MSYSYVTVNAFAKSCFVPMKHPKIPDPYSIVNQNEELKVKLKRRYIRSILCSV